MNEVAKIEVPVALLADFANLIDMVTPRGGFKGEEMEGVGKLRNFCVSEVEAFNRAQQAPVAPPVEVDEDDEDDEEVSNPELLLEDQE